MLYERKITVLMVEPGKAPKTVMLKTDLDSLQKAVSIGADYQGLLEIITIDDGVCILCNEEGKLIGLEGNRRLGNDIIAGVFYVVGENAEGELISLSKEKLAFYEAFFHESQSIDAEEVAAALFFRFL